MASVFRLCNILRAIFFAVFSFLCSPFAAHWLGFLKDSPSNINALIKSLFSPPTHPSAHVTLHAHSYTCKARARQRTAQPLKGVFLFLCSTFCRCYLTFILDDGGNKSVDVHLTAVLSPLIDQFGDKNDRTTQRKFTKLR